MKQKTSHFLDCKGTTFFLFVQYFSKKIYLRINQAFEPIFCVLLPPFRLWTAPFLD